MLMAFLFGAIAADSHLAPKPAFVFGGVEKEPTAIITAALLNPRAI
jgi:hypothetical protein